MSNSMREVLGRHAARMALFVPCAALLCGPLPGSASTVPLGSAQDFAVLGASTVTNTGSTTVFGDLGLYPGTSITGIPPGVVSGGTIHPTDAVAQQARTDAFTAYATLGGLPFDHDYTGSVLGSTGYSTLAPGVYHFGASAQLTGLLTLDFSSDPTGYFIFQIGGALTTASGASVDVVNGGPLSGVYWLVGSSATLGTATSFAGNILADQSITLNTAAAILGGRAIALNGAVTLDTNQISNNSTLQDFGTGRSDFGSYGFSGGEAPEPGTFMLLGAGLGACLALLRKFRASQV